MSRIKNPTKRIFALILCVLMLSATLVVAHAEGERGVRNHCIYCDDGYLVYATYDLGDARIVKKACTHGTGGQDIYVAHTEEYREECSKCAYSSVLSRSTVEEFSYCTG